MATLTLHPADRSVAFDAPAGLSDLAADAEILIDHPCGSNATCGKCRVRFREGVTVPTEADRRLIDPADLESGWRLACQCVVEHDAAVEIPLHAQLRGVKTFGPEHLAGRVHPQVRRLHLTLREPDLDHQLALLDSIRLAAEWPRPIATTLPLLRALPVEAWTDGGRVSVVLDGNEIVAFESGIDCTRLAGVAVDLGSTSVAAALIDLETGDVLGIADDLNPQVRFGADVIARIDHAQRQTNGNADLHRAAVTVIADLTRRLAGQCGIEPRSLVAMTLAGNPAMLHTFLGVDVRALGQAPYVGTWTGPVAVKAADLGLPLCPTANVRLFPQVRSNVGGDTVAAVIATDLDRAEGLTMLIDLGTNSEIVLGHSRRAIATSTAAGPAFEGASIRQGMRAAPGAIDRVSVRARGGLRVHVIGNGKARGLCGTGLIDAVAALRRLGLIDASGRMMRHHEMGDGQRPDIRARLIAGEHGHPAVVLAPPDEAHGGVPVMLTAQDVRQLQLIKGSIMAGAQILLERWGASWGEVDRVCIAGAFGTHVRKASALTIGLLPPVDPERITFVGNAAGIGARLALVDRHAWERAIVFSQRCEYVELGFLPEYQWAFAEAMRFPEVAA